MARYVPDAGDIIWLNFDPQIGREQAGRRPALVLSPAGYNDKAGLLVCCPVTSRAKGYPFELTLSGKTQGVVLVDQVKSVDWPGRKAALKNRAQSAELEGVRELLHSLIG